MDSSLCGLGKSAPSPVLSTIKEFREEYESHVLDNFCPTGKCAELFDFWINPDLCKGCTLCAKECPTNAITGEKKEPHKIAQQDCTKCGTCRTTCKFGAVEAVRVGTYQ
jgi:NADH-quinone oxidoreductase subunit F